MKVSRFWQAAMIVMSVALLSAPLVEAQGRGRQATSDATLEAMNRAIQDEYHAEFVYLKVIEKSGDVVPFSNIVNAERRHSSVVARLFTNRDLPVPESNWNLDNVPEFDSVASACSAGVVAERENIALYDELLTQDLPRDVHNVFTNIRAASLNNHLPAFEACGSPTQGRGAGQGRGVGQGWRRGEGGARDQQVERHFDPDTVATVTGTVQDVLSNAGTAGSTGMHLLLDVDGESIEADIGPSSYLTANGLEVESGDHVTVTGSKTTVDGEPAFIASQITSGDVSLTLRDGAGIPVWGGQGPRAVAGGRGPGVGGGDGASAPVRGRRAVATGGGYGRGAGAVATGAGYGRGPRAVTTGAGYGRGARAVTTGARYGRGARAVTTGAGFGRGARAVTTIGAGYGRRAQAAPGFGCRRGQRRGGGIGRGAGPR